MKHYKVTVSIIKNGETPFLETHYATGEQSSKEGAVLSVKNTISKAYREKFPEDKWEVLQAPGGVIEVSEAEYNLAFKQ